MLDGTWRHRIRQARVEDHRFTPQAHLAHTEWYCHASAVVTEGVGVVVGAQRRADRHAFPGLDVLRARGMHAQRVDQRGGRGNAQFDVETDFDEHDGLTLRRWKEDQARSVPAGHVAELILMPARVDAWDETISRKAALESNAKSSGGLFVGAVLPQSPGPSHTPRRAGHHYGVRRRRRLSCADRLPQPPVAPPSQPEGISR